MPDLIALPSATTRPARTRYLLAACLMIILAAASALRSAGLFADDLYWLQEDLGGDKAVHLMTGMVVMAAGWLLFLPRSGKAITILLLAVLIALSLDELAQFNVKTREFDLFDLAAGAAGAGLLALAIAVLPWLRPQMTTIREGRPDSR